MLRNSFGTYITTVTAEYKGSVFLGQFGGQFSILIWWVRSLLTEEAGSSAAAAATSSVRRCTNEPAVLQPLCPSLLCFILLFAWPRGVSDVPRGSPHLGLFLHIMYLVQVGAVLVDSWFPFSLDIHAGHGAERRDSVPVHREG